MHLLFLPLFPLHRADIVFLLGLSFHLLFLCFKTKKRWKESWETDYEPGGQVPSRLPASGHINIGLAGIRELVNGLTVRPWAPFLSLSLSRRCLGQPSDAVTGVPFFYSRAPKEMLDQRLMSAQLSPFSGGLHLFLSLLEVFKLQ